ncbi:MAG: hypothetical protein U1E91_03525 [Moraxella sp.]
MAHYNKKMYSLLPLGVHWWVVKTNSLATSWVKIEITDDDVLAKSGKRFHPILLKPITQPTKWQV